MIKHIMYLGGEASCFCKVIDNLLFLQVVGVDGVSTVCPIEINHFIPHQARLYEKEGRMRADSVKFCYYTPEIPNKVSNNLSLVPPLSVAYHFSLMLAYNLKG